MIAVIRFPGSNCDEDTRHALARLGAEAKLVWHRETSLTGVSGVVLPGGFSYGDYLRSGAIAARSPIMSAVRDFAMRGGPVLGICNGFQILTESGLLPGALARNRSPHFLCRPATVRVERDDLPLTRYYRKGDVLTLPIAHAEGRYYADPETLAKLEARGGVVFRYCAANDSLSGPASSAAGPAAISEAGPNGSVAGIAGIINERGNVLGMMPHPERAVEPLLGGEDGVPLLRALIGAVGDGSATYGTASGHDDRGEVAKSR